MENTYCNEKYLHYMFAHCLSPVVEKCKPAGLITVWKYRIPHVDLNTFLFHDEHSFLKGCLVKVLKETPLYYLLFFYREDLLEKQLSSLEDTSLLNQYPMEGNMEDVIQFLKVRVEECHLEKEAFPHEIGLFLGYPLWDVEEFIRLKGQNYKLCGYWKVYDDVDGAKAKFKEYDKIRSTAIQGFYKLIERNNQKKEEKRYPVC